MSINEQPGGGKYRCTMCKGIFEFGWSPEEATIEAEEHGLDIEECGMVCDPCYKKTPWGVSGWEQRGGPTGTLIDKSEKAINEKDMYVIVSSQCAAGYKPLIHEQDVAGATLDNLRKKIKHFKKTNYPGNFRIAKLVFIDEGE